MSTEWTYDPNPYLPNVTRVLGARDLEILGADRGRDFYITALLYAQSLWRTGFPAKSLLLCNRAFSADLKGCEEILENHPLPYNAVAWVIVNRPEGCFIGNPRRHYQHLATRMVEPRKELRSWRAWACWYLAKEVLSEADFPGDEKQILEEGIIEPTRGMIRERLNALSGEGEVNEWEKAIRWITPWKKGNRQSRLRVRVRKISAGELPTVRALALKIWPKVYPEIISREQIRYMLGRFYDLEQMRDEITRRGVCFALIDIDGQPGGYLSFEVLRGERTAFLHKLYVCPEFHGAGAGALALRWVVESAARLGLGAVRLRVNKHNAQAIRAYLRSGFHFAGEVTSDIGGGFVMDDYWMQRDIGCSQKPLISE
jgi:RimJ/RimL family protein N-acetyltransferase